MLKKQPNGSFDQLEKKKRLILWTGVVGLTIIIFAMWILNTKILLYRERTVEAPPNPLTAVKADFREVMDLLQDENLAFPSLSTSTQAAEENATEPEDIKTLLKSTLLPFLASNTPTTTPLSGASTTTIKQ